MGGYVYCFFGVTAPTDAALVSANVALAQYLPNVQQSGGVLMTSGRAYITTAAPMTAAEAAAWLASLGATSYSLVFQGAGYFKHMNVEYVAL